MRIRQSLMKALNILGICILASGGLIGCSSTAPKAIPQTEINAEVVQRIGSTTAERVANNKSVIARVIVEKPRFLTQNEVILTDYAAVQQAWLEASRSGKATTTFAESPQYKNYIEKITRSQKQEKNVELSKLAATALRTSLVGAPHLIVSARNTSNASVPTFKLFVQVTEYVPDVEKASAAVTGVQQAAGHALSTAASIAAATAPGAAAALGPAGGIVSAFDSITGIPTKSSGAEKHGTVGLDISILETSTGKIISSFPVQASFSNKSDRVGTDGIGSHSFDNKGSTVHDAILVAAQEGAAKVAQIISSVQR